MKAFTLQPALAAAHVLALDQLSASATSAGPDGPGGWTAEVLTCCEEQLAGYLEAHSQGGGAAAGLPADAEEMSPADSGAAAAVFAAGEVQRWSSPPCCMMPVCERALRCPAGNVAPETLFESLKRSCTLSLAWEGRDWNLYRDVLIGAGMGRL